MTNERKKRYNIELQSEEIAVIPSRDRLEPARGNRKAVYAALPTPTTSSRTAEPQNTLLDLARKEGHVPTFSVSKNSKRGGLKIGEFEKSRSSPILIHPFLSVLLYSLNDILCY